MSTGRVPTTANSPLTAKGDLFGYSTTQARVPVGNDGETLVADSSASTGLRWQTGFNSNAIINGGFDIWQRGTSTNITTTYAYSADRWQTAASGASGTLGTVTRQTVSDTTNLPTIQYCARVQRTAGSTATQSPVINLSLESSDSYRFAGQTVTVSFYARAGANYSSASSALAYYLFSGTGTDQNIGTTGFTGQATTASGTATLTTTWQRFSYTATVAATATQLALWFQFTPTGTAGAADYFEITGVQLELGSVATRFKRAAGTLAGELAACERYYQIVTGQMLSGVNANVVGGSINFRTQMRTGPSVSLSAAMNLRDAGADYAQTSANVSITASRTNERGIQIEMANFPGTITANRPYYTNVTLSQIQFSAEL